jgi:hypothetical protein
MLTKDQVTQLYIAMFQRAPSKSEIDYWYNSAQQNGMDIIGLANTMVNAAKDATHMFGLEDLYPQYANYDPNNPDSIKAIINSVYSTIFNKDATQDPNGVDYWTNEVLNGKSLGEVIVAIENAAKDIAEHPDKYQNQFDQNTLNHAINAAHAFEDKVKAAEKIAEQISNVKTDPQSLEKMKEVIKEVKDDDDINKVLNEVNNIKNQVEDSAAVQNHNDNINNYSDDDDYDDFQDVKAFLSVMNNNDKIQFYNLLKEYFQKEASIYNSHNGYTPDVLNQLANEENDITKKSNALFEKYGFPADDGVWSVTPDFLNHDPSKLQEYYNTEKQHYNDLLNELNKVNPLDPDSYKDLYAKDNQYMNKLDSIIDEWPVDEDYHDDDDDYGYTDNYDLDDYGYNGYNNDMVSFDNGDALKEYQDYINQMYNTLSSYGIDVSQCQAAENKMLNQIEKLNYDQLQSLDNDLVNYIYNHANDITTIDSLKNYIHGLEDIYAKYGVDMKSYDEACGLDLNFDNLDNYYIDGYNI